jgi:hypothetical protein
MWVAVASRVWPFVLTAAIGFGVAWHYQGGRLAKLELQALRDTVRINDEWRAKERTWETNGRAAETQYANDRATWEANRNRGAGAPVRVCKPTDPAPRATPGSAAVAGPIAPSAAPGLVPQPVPEGADVGPMLRLVIAEAERVSDQLRAVLAERQGLSQ